MKKDSFIKPFKLTTKHTYANVVTGATLTISLEDARGMLAMTSLDSLKDSDKYGDDAHQDYCTIAEQSRLFIRNIAKRILLTEGETTNSEDLVDKFTKPSPPKEKFELSPVPETTGKIEID